jgi:alkylresorcinol/alkylpyrone synthase
MTRPAAHIRALGTAVPAFEITQEDIAARARRVLGIDMPDYERLAPVFDNAGIGTRYVSRPSDWYEAEQDWASRMDAYLEVATELFALAAEDALARAGLTGADIGAIVTVSSTGIAAPSLEARCSARLGFRSDVTRVPVFGLGCAGGVTGLAIAARLAEAAPGTNVLMVAVELCSLAVRRDMLTKANVVALALFGDGAAAAIVRAGDGGLARIDGGGEHTWPDTLDIMGWSVDREGFGVIFDRSIPPFATNHLAPAVGAILNGLGSAAGEVDRFVCHPGGAKVIEAIEGSLKLGTGALDHERAVLARYGNMSAPTALFVLDRAMSAGLPPRSFLMALGPGFTLSGVLLSQAA